MTKLGLQVLVGLVGIILLAVSITLWATDTWGDAFYLALMLSMYANGLSLGISFGK